MRFFPRFPSMSKVLAALMMTAVATPLLAQEIKSANWRWAHFAPPAWGSAQAEQLFADEITKATDEKIKIKFFWSGTLFGFSEVFGAVRGNVVEVASVVPTYHPSEWPLMGLVNSLPMVWTDPEVAMKTQAYLIENNEALKQELERNKMMPILIHGLPPYRLQCTSPVRTLEDLKGKRIRTFGEWPPYVMEQLGAIPVNIPLEEIYEGLQKGTLDCGYNPTENAGFLKLSEVAKYWSDINFGAIAAYTTFMNMDRYNALPDSLKEIMKEASDKAVAFELSNFEPLEQKGLEEAQAAGVTLVEFEDQDKLEAMFPNMLDVWEEATCKRHADICEGAKSVVADVRKVMEEHAAASNSN